MNENSLKTEILMSFEVKGQCKWKFEIADPGSCKLLYENLDNNSEKHVVSITYFFGGEQTISATAYIIETTINIDGFSVKHINNIKASCKTFSLLDLIKDGLINEKFTVNGSYNAELTITLGEGIPNENIYCF